MSETVVLEIKRQNHPGDEPRWEKFHIRSRPYLNVISCLLDIRKNPVLLDGRETTPIAWEANCLEEVCGACTMVINGRVRQACTALVDHLKQPIVLEPMTKFPVIRDLVVDRSSMFEALKKVRAWVPIESIEGLDPGPKISQRNQEIAYELSRCMTCGCCLEACPQVNSRSSFIGAAAISQVRFFNMHPTGAREKLLRLKALMQPGGIEDCGNAQNCVQVCPKNIPLTTSIAEVNREISLELLNLLKS
jgi:succinate dehydrogenase / fumarate reductase iron-sulfur subunit